MTLARLKYSLLESGVVLTMFFLYIKTQAFDLDTHNQMLDHGSRFKQIDTVLNQNTLEIRQGQLPFMIQLSTM